MHCFPATRNFSFFVYRLLGGLLSAHLLIVDENKYLGDFQLEDYDNELLDMYAHIILAISICLLFYHLSLNFFFIFFLHNL
jgi:hypothetical protein